MDGQLRPGAFVPPTAYEAYVRGELAIAQGRFAAAVAQLELSTTAPDEDAFLLARLAYAQALAGLPEEAERTLRHAARVDACSEAVWLTRGELLERSGSLTEAASAYGRAGECAPRSSRGPIQQARVLERAGKRSEAVQVLGMSAGQDHPKAAQAGLELALRAEDSTALAHALDTWIAYESPDSATLQRAIRWALMHGKPQLAQRVREHHLEPLPPSLEADLKRALGDRRGLLELLGRSGATDLGGPQHAAELALYAGDPARAELEASQVLAQTPSDAAYAVRAEARLRLGRYTEALADLRAIGDEAIKRNTLAALLSAHGLPALADELEGSAVGTGASR